MGVWRIGAAWWLAVLLVMPGHAGTLAERGGDHDHGSDTLVLVAGASGDTGRHIVAQLLAAGYRVRPLTTNAFRARERGGPEAEWLEVDVRDPAAVAEAMREVDYVICALGAREARGENSPRYVDYGGVRHLVDAAREAGVRHFVLISSAAAGSHRDHRENPRLGYVLYWKTRGELYLRASGLDYTVIGPGRLTDGPAAHSGILVSSREDYRRASIARADVARLAIASLVEPAARNKSFAVVNEADLGPDDWLVALRALPRDHKPPSR
jgi:uncharacterized protein YbjT (DUF2867 family)